MIKLKGKGRVETLLDKVVDNVVDKVNDVVDTVGSVVFGDGGNDLIIGGDGNDRIHGGGGNDTLIGNLGNDVIFGASSRGGVVDLDKLRINEDVTGTVTFLGESAGYQNTLGMYKIASDGTIYDVDVLFANASLKGSGGNLEAGVSSVSVDLSAGDRVGFFVIPNGYAQAGMAKLLADEKGSFKFVGADGGPGNVGDGSLKLIHVAPTGTETVVKSNYGQSIFHSTGVDTNGDGLKHATGSVDVVTGSVTIGFEDLWKGGDKDFDDSVFRFDVGQTNAALLPKVSTGGLLRSDDDVISGGDGADTLFGMAGNDAVSGGEGNDLLWGNSGDDSLFGGNGDDVLRGGSGDDVARGDAGNDILEGNSGNDTLYGDAGDDTLLGGSGDDVIFDGAGDDKVEGGSGDDRVVVGLGRDVYAGGSGFDTLDFSKAEIGVNVDMSKGTASGYGDKTFSGMEAVVGSDHSDDLRGGKHDDVIAGGDGDDTIRGMGGADTLTGGAGQDRFVWLAKDVLAETSGAHLGVDTITDLQVGDRIDLTQLVKGQSYGSLDEVVNVTDTGKGATVSVKLGGVFVDVVTVEGLTAADVVDSGALLV
ncbi:MAG: calcium-binding protein [Hyphomicrobiaceae bacterium]|nr:calcium-binding protein [Hyphomicrobiaceae bacterium]